MSMVVLEFLLGNIAKRFPRQFFSFSFRQKWKNAKSHFLC